MRPKRLTIGMLLGVVGCFGIIFATALHVENLGFWVLWFTVLPLLGGLYGTYKQGFGGFVGGSLYGALLLPLGLVLLLVVSIWLLLFSMILSQFLSSA